MWGPRLKYKTIFLDQAALESNALPFDTLDGLLQVSLHLI